VQYWRWLPTFRRKLLPKLLTVSNTTQRKKPENQNVNLPRCENLKPRNTRIHYRVLKTPAIGTYQGQFSQVHILTICYCNIHFNIIPPSNLKSPNKTFTSKFRNHKFEYISCFLFHLTTLFLLHRILRIEWKDNENNEMWRKWSKWLVVSFKAAKTATDKLFDRRFEIEPTKFLTWNKSVKT
jgi:hypothetical protein